MKSILHLYLRVSSSIQVEGTSLKTQKEIGIALAKKLGMGYEVHNEGGKSSAKDDLHNRPIMMHLLRLMDKGMVRHLYVWNTDRLSRNQITWYSIRQKMVKNEVVLYTPKGIHNQQDEMENMILGILSEVSQYDNKIRAERSRLGKFEKVKLNYWRGGDCAFGYKLESDGIGNKLVENETESKWVKFLFSEYSKGISLNKIKAMFEKNKIRTRRGNELWSLGSLQVILRNELYIGIQNYFDKKSKQTITNRVPQIISNKLFEIVTERRKLILQRKGQLNRTEKFYLFRDFLICGGCSTPMGGKINPKRNVNTYYCPITERKFNNSYKQNIECEMKKSIHIPTTDAILWKTICGILSNSFALKEQFKSRTIVNTDEIKSLIKQKEIGIKKFTSEKNEIEKGLVKIETEHLLGNYSSKNVFEKLKKELNNRYKKILTQIEDLNNSLTDLGDKENWLNWIDGFGQVIRNNENISDVRKKDFLTSILENIIVNYDYTEKLHRLKINFKLPVILEDFKVSKNFSKSSISLSNHRDQISLVGTYSTVTDLARFLG